MSACNDFHHTSEAQRRRFLAEGLTRRQVLLGGLGAGLALYGAGNRSTASLLDGAATAAAASPDEPVLVTVFLPGGCDLLDALVPLHQEGRYADLRSGTRVVGAPALGRTGLGIHPSLAEGADGGVKGLFERGQVAFLPGIDYASPDLSHFHSRHFWESGVITGKLATGWLGRWLDVAGLGDNPFQGVSVGYGLSPLLRSAGAPVASLAGVMHADLPMWTQDADSRAAALEAFAAMASATNGKRGSGRAAVGRGIRLAMGADRTLAPVAAAQKAQGDPPPTLSSLLTGVGGSASSTALSRDLDAVVELLRLGVGVRTAVVTAPGDFDTHDGQQGRLRTQLGDVSKAVSKFQADLAASGLADRVVTLVWSEFGRRARANMSAGTDHGAGGLAWLQGPRVRGGIATDYPDLNTVDRLGNLQVTVDFRRVYASLLEGWLATDAAAVLPDAATVGRLQLIA